MEQLIGLNALQAAPKALGMELVYDSPRGKVSGIITEVEAYRPDDPASHSFRPMTARTSALFGAPGTVYIYFIYGKHYCLNIVLGNGEALLIRGVEPRGGIEIMQHNRDTTDIRALCNGPAKVVQAFGIPKTLNGSSFLQGPLHLKPGKRIMTEQIMTSPRVGISKAADKPWRFTVVLR